MIYKAPNKIPKHIRNGVFLAGSIEMGTAENWQEKTEQELAKRMIPVFNPRRDDWDSSWVQSINNPSFRRQVEWELNALDQAYRIILYLSPGTKSPISLLELGLFAQSGKLLVCCPESFWRRGNVEIVCLRYEVPFFENLDELLDTLWR